MPRKKGSKNKIKLYPIKDGIPTSPFRVSEIVQSRDEGSAPNPFIIKATLKVLGRVYESQGTTPDEVLSNFKTQNWIKGAGVLSVTKNGITKDKIIAGNHIKNVFGMASGTMRAVSLKFVKALF